MGGVKVLQGLPEGLFLMEGRVPIRKASGQNLPLSPPFVSFMLRLANDGGWGAQSKTTSFGRGFLLILIQCGIDVRKQVYDPRGEGTRKRRINRIERNIYQKQGWICQSSISME